MKKAIVVLSILIVCVFVSVFAIGNQRDEYLRIHIRANSNEDLDQTIKYIVKDKIVSTIKPYILNVESKEEAMQIVYSLIPTLTKTTNEELEKCGFNYKSNISLKGEKFPKRSYGNLTLDSGVYDALIVELGQGEGDNWWCVVFPPLCFIGVESDRISYSSFIKEKIEEWSKN